MTTEAQGLMQAAAEVARKSGDVALGFFRQGVTVDIKGDGTPVTVADRTSEQTARDWIESRFPQDGILGEEFGETRPGAKRGSLSNASRTAPATRAGTRSAGTWSRRGWRWESCRCPGRASRSTGSDTLRSVSGGGA